MLNQPTRPSTGPSAIFYLVGVLVIIAGILIGVIPFIATISKMDTWLTRVTVPGTSDITLAEPGKYTIYHEHHTVVDGKPHSSMNADPGRLDCHLTSKATGREVALSAPSMDETYSAGARAGVGVMVFTIDEPGDYTLTATYREGESGPDMVLAIGKGVLKRIFTAFLKLVVPAGAGVIIGILIIIVTAIKRGKARRAVGSVPPPTAYPPAPGTGA